MKRLKNQSWTILMVILLLANVYTIVQGITLGRKQVLSRGRIKKVGVEVYWDASGTDTIIQVDWGMLEPGQASKVLIYIKNTGNSPITLVLYTSDWLPEETGTYITLGWNYTSAVLDKKEIIPVELTLTVSPDILDIDVFDFIITIEGTG